MAEPYRIRCSEIWGGVRTVDTDVCTLALSASLYSSACGGDKGGDIYYFSVCSIDLLTRIAIADVRGHGEQVSQLSGWLFHSLEERMNSLEGNGVLTGLNRMVNTHGFDALTTAVLASYCLRDGHLYFSNAGHPPLLLDRKSPCQWRRLELPDSGERVNLPLGVLPEAEYSQSSVRLEPGDRFFLYTDGVLECPNTDDEEFGEERLLDVLARSSGATLAGVKRAVLQSISEHRGPRCVEDDITFLVAEVRDGSPLD
jgi:sigma-B regulation protein RsbU (phosphoserine phosphatase)